MRTEDLRLARYSIFDFATSFIFRFLLFFDVSLIFNISGEISAGVSGLPMYWIPDNWNFTVYRYYKLMVKMGLRSSTRNFHVIVIG